MDFIRFLIYICMVLYVWCVVATYNICSTWFLDIRITTWFFCVLCVLWCDPVYISQCMGDNNNNSGT